MFAKLLKHDIKAVYKYWWIGAGASFLLSLIGGFCMKLVNIDYTKYEIFPVLGGIGVTIARVGIYLLPVFTTMLLVIRYYKHFFTDEGYLTFTLPVSKNTLVDSKIISGTIYSLLSTAVSFLCLYIIILIGEPEIIGTSDFLYEYSSVLYNLSFLVFGYKFNFGVFETMGVYAFPYIMLMILLIVASVFVQLLFIYACITTASSLVKKHKVITAIGIYYGASSVIGAVLSVLFVIGLFSFYSTPYDSYYETGVTNNYAVTLLGMTVALGCMVMAIGLMYLLLTFLLDKKLNLE